MLIDTNILIYLLQGNDTLAELLQGKQLAISFITELELFGLFGATPIQENQIEDLLSRFQIVQMTPDIKANYRNIRRTNKIKLADSLVAATALSLKLPLMTADKGFKTIKELDLVQYEPRV